MYAACQVLVWELMAALSGGGKVRRSLLLL